MQVNQKKGTGTPEKNIISQMWFKYFPYWPLFLLFVVVGGVYAKFKLRHSIPLYETTASILIKDEKKGENASQMMESLNQLSSKKIIENEMEVLRSRELMVEVVRKLHLYAPVTEDRKIEPVSAYLSSPVIIEAYNPDSLETEKVYFTFNAGTKQISFENKSYPLDEWVSTPYGKLKFIPNNLEYDNKNPLYFYLISPKKVAVSLVQQLEITPASKLASVINLKILDEVPKRAEDILNNLLLAYNLSAINTKNTLARNTLVFVDERLKSVAHDLDSIEKKLQQYKTNSGAVDISSQGALFLQNVNQGDQKLSDVNTQLVVLSQIENYVKAKDNAGGIVPSTVGVNDPLLSQLLDKLYDSELQYERLRKTTPENNPILLSISNQIEKIRPSILENIKSQKASLEANRNNLSSSNSKFSSILQSIPQKERELVEISREQSVKSGVYNFLLQKHEETELSLRATVTDNRVVDKAQSSFGPVFPEPTKTYIMSCVIALIFAFGLITLTEIFKRTILYRHEIESYTSVPVIAEISHEKSKDPLVIGNGKRSLIAEQFRNLRTSLAYTGLTKEKKKLLVTSTISGEGKSFVVANLGVSLAMAGKKVVVLEFDLSDPTLSKKLGAPANKGLSEYLTDNNIEPEEIIWRTTVQKDLFIIPSGSLPENPSELIMSERVPELLDYLSEIFDYIILDSAPVGFLSDAYVLSKYCDATLYVVRHRHTRKVFIQRLDENNRINELKNMAIVFNGVRSRGFNKNAYGYGYGYGYGYINNGKKKKKPA